MKNNKIYIVHGWTYRLSKWDEIVKLLKKLGFEPVLLKVPGLSEPSEEVWDINKYVAWLRTKLKDEDQVIAIGQSNGGRMLMAYDVAHPGQLKHLFLISSAGVYHDSKKISLKKRIFKIIAKMLKPFIKGISRRMMYRLIGAPDYGNAQPNMRKTLQNVTEYDKTFDITKVSVPSTLIWGEKDYVTPLSDAYTIKSQLQNFVGLHIIEGVKHSPQGSKPAEVAEIIRTVIEEIS